MTSEKKETKKFVVPVTWLVATEVVIEAESEDEAMDLANNIDLSGVDFNNADYVQGSFDVDFGMIEEVPTPEDTQAAVEDYVFWREAIEGVK
ncbi:hypothetical protein [Hyphomonas sp.]|uniref:hypothetical protein n=1 Tax=Hyphomonas sp. TaxID=87 RepID=UPI000C977A29|nr:hypothetical protein [Hyphomonas sp.]MAL46062.1 hypothetical protein [Hyphomonas sp.]